jgi:hypothetical protein
MALVIAIAFELIIAVQTVVFLVAPLAGILIGVYANVRSERWRPRWKVLTNAAYAGLVTGVALALLYVVLRLVFVYGDTGTRPDGTRIDCAGGPACTYARYVEAGRGDELTALGITDARSFEAATWQEQLTGGALLVFVTTAGAIVGGGLRNVRQPPQASLAGAGGVAAG